jgi:hypothetical protein
MISVLRAGANAPAIDRAVLHSEVEALPFRHDVAHDSAVRPRCRG